MTFVYGTNHAVRLTIIGQCAAHADDKASTSCSEGTATGAIISVLPEQPVIFLVYTDRILDFNGAAIVSNEAARLVNYENRFFRGAGSDLRGNV